MTRAITVEWPTSQQPSSFTTPSIIPKQEHHLEHRMLSNRLPPWFGSFFIPIVLGPNCDSYPEIVVSRWLFISALLDPREPYQILPAPIWHYGFSLQHGRNVSASWDWKLWKLETDLHLAMSTLSLVVDRVMIWAYLSIILRSTWLCRFMIPPIARPVYLGKRMWTTDCPYESKRKKEIYILHDASNLMAYQTPWDPPNHYLRDDENDWFPRIQACDL